ncbi:MAG: GntG family PLP-dependent aldolase [Pseudomonadota bacterium]
MANFYSDTQTQPSRAMRETVLTAAVGDEQSDLDPTTNALNARVAALLQKEAAVFLPSGTMCNEIALAVHCRPGDEIICDRVSHIVEAEGGGPAALAHATVHPLDGERGMPSVAQVRQAIRSPSRYSPRSRVLSIEQTVNMAGGAVWDTDHLHAVAEVAKAAGLATHLDGARLLNASVATGVSAGHYAANYDSVWIDFTKGLGAPIGAVMAGSADFIFNAWQLKQRWGGAMRQSGIAAAMCLYALDHNVERLAEDHALARHLADHISEMPGVINVLPVETNIVIFDLDDSGPDADTVVERTAARGVRIGAFGPRRLRVVTHLDVGAADGEILLSALQDALGAQH